MKDILIKLIKQFSKFCLSGIIAVVIDIFLYYSFLFFQINIFIAKLVSYVFATCISFVINKFWTFNSQLFKKREILRCIIVYSFSSIINSLVNMSCLKILKQQLIAYVLAIGISTIINFLGLRYFVFEKENGV